MELSRRECNILKGWSIMTIIFHNYCRRIPNAAIENEFTWKIEKTLYFYTHYYDSYLTNFFSFLGHYGVVIFVFLSGYGLVKKYEINTNETISKKSFVVKHYLKLTPLLLGGISLYWITHYILNSELTGLSIYQIIAQLSYTVNLIPMQFLGIYPGPYWYFGMTMELYVIYIFLIYRKKVIIPITICIICLVSLYLSNGHYLTQTWLKLNFIGSFFPFTLGLLFAKNQLHISLPMINIPQRYHVSTNNRFLKRTKCYLKKILLVLCILFFISVTLLFEKFYFTWVFIAIPVLGLAFCVIRLYYGHNSCIMEEVGRRSNLLFVIHPIIREIPLAYRDCLINHPYIFLTFYLLFSFLTITPFRYYLDSLHLIARNIFGK